jgi:NAD(P)-dependent dehydrogenase (short-subunit alcohol dehydrogenase family)
MDEFEGKTAVVTGGASGIGKAMATRFAADGMNVLLADIEEPALAEAAAELEAKGASIATIVADVSDAERVEAIAQAAMDRFGAIHVACNNAGVGGGGLAWEIEPAMWDWVLGVNLMGVIHGVRAFVPRIIESGGGHVVNTASMAGLTSPPFMSPYNVAKHGVVTLSEGLYQELQMMHPEVGVSVLCPGWVNTRIHEADRNQPDTLAQPDDAGEDGDEDLLNMRDMMAGFIENGMDPADVAGLVSDAIRDEKFYILTHDDWNVAVTSRMDRIKAGENPTMMLPIDP